MLHNFVRTFGIMTCLLLITSIGSFADDWDQLCKNAVQTGKKTPGTATHQPGIQIVIVDGVQPPPGHEKGPADALVHLEDGDHIIWCGKTKDLEFRILSICPHPPNAAQHNAGVKKGTQCDPFFRTMPQPPAPAGQPHYRNVVRSGPAKPNQGSYSYKFLVEMKDGTLIDPHIETHCGSTMCG